MELSVGGPMALTHHDDLAQAASIYGDTQVGPNADLAWRATGHLAASLEALSQSQIQVAAALGSAVFQAEQLEERAEANWHRLVELSQGPPPGLSTGHALDAGLADLAAAESEWEAIRAEADTLDRHLADEIAEISLGEPPPIDPASVGIAINNLADGARLETGLRDTLEALSDEIMSSATEADREQVAAYERLLALWVPREWAADLALYGDPEFVMNVEAILAADPTTDMGEVLYTVVGMGDGAFQPIDGFNFGDTGRPDIHHDNGFLQNPNDPSDPVPLPTRPPTDGERAFYDSEVRKAFGADYVSELPLPSFVGRLSLERGIEAYRHFLTGEGQPRTFDYESYLHDDESGRAAFAGATALAQRGADGTYQWMLDRALVKPGEPVTFTITSDPYPVGPPNPEDHPISYPYPASEDWQKTIGAHQMWTVTEVTYTPDSDGVVQVDATMTLHAEDRYNFNPGQHDIGTGEDDSVRGVLEESGLAHQYDHSGTAIHTTTWTQGAPNAPIASSVEPSR